MSANRYLYHYCARHQNGSELTYIDGVAQLQGRIVTQEDYRKLKSLIAPEDAYRLTIESLSFLGMENDQPTNQTKEGE